MSLEDQYDDAMFAFSTGDYTAAAAKLEALVRQDPGFFDAQLALGMAYCRQGNLPAAIEEGHRAERLRPDDPLVHTNLSLFYLKSGDKTKAEQHGLKARIASWKTPGTTGETGPGDAPLEQAKPPVSAVPPVPVPDRPWLKKHP
jgi:predicted Zn-dependent protease